MEMKNFCTMLAVAATAWLSAEPAVAARIHADPTTPLVALGSRFDLHISGSEFSDGVDGGDFNLQWDPSVLTYVGTAFDDPPWDLSFLDESGAEFGNLYVDLFSFLDTPGTFGVAFDIATVTFEVVGSPPPPDPACQPPDADPDCPPQLPEGTTELFLFPEVGWSLGGESVFAEYDSDVSVVILPIPEPSMTTSIALGLALLGAYRPRSSDGRPES